MGWKVSAIFNNENDFERFVCLLVIHVAFISESEDDSVIIFVISMFCLIAVNR